MVKDYIEKNIDKIDRNGDGVIGYVLAIGDIGHNDSIARTRGVRKALGTAVDKNGEADSAPAGTNTDGKASQVQDGSIEVGGKTYVIRELASQEMKNSAGATWDAATAGNAIGTWSSSFGDSIDVVVSNNDGMGMSMFNAWSKDNGMSLLKSKALMATSCPSINPSTLSWSTNLLMTVIFACGLMESNLLARLSAL
jgi:methyl-galactoside transport system substrate-binding protein